MAVANAGGVRYVDAIGQVQRFCKMKSEPVTARKIVKAMYEHFRLRGGETCLTKEEDRQVKTVLRVGEAKK